MTFVTLVACAAILWLLVLRQRLKSRKTVLETEMADLRHSLELLRDLQRQQQAIFDNIPDLIWLKNTENRYLFVNKAFGQACGRSTDELIGKTAVDVWPRDLAEKYRQDDALVAASGIRKRIEEPLQYSTGERKWVDTIKIPVKDADGRVIGTSGIARDIDEHKRLQKAMIQTEKMVTVGGLAAGMAHELNNPLGAILQHVQNIQRRITGGLTANEAAALEVGVDLGQVRRYLDRRGINEMLDHISVAGVRAANIIENMLAFSRTGAATLEATPLPRLMDKAVEMAAGDCDSSNGCDFQAITIVREFDEGMPPIVINRLEMERVLVNIVKNAAQALGESRPDVPPQIILRTRIAGNCACIDITDNGPGMPPDIAKRVFEPFFTTREVGVGTGLGLSVAYALVVDNHRGAIDVESSPGKGTTFTINLPLGIGYATDRSPHRLAA